MGAVPAGPRDRSVRWPSSRTEVRDEVLLTFANHAEPQSLNPHISATTDTSARSGAYLERPSPDAVYASSA